MKLKRVPRENKKIKAEAASKALAEKIVDAVFPFLRNRGTCCCGSSFVSKDRIVEELTGRVLAALP
jgi:hypothetical protein